MKVSLWAEIRRLHEIEKLSARAIASRLHCSRHTVHKALALRFDGNRYSVPPEVARKPVTLRADRNELRVIYEGTEVARHVRCYDKRQLLVLPDHQLAAIQMRRE